MPVIRSGRSRTATDTKKGKLLISHRYNRIPLLNSLPGGFYRSWSYKTYPNAKVTLFSESANILRKIRRKKGGKTFAQMFPSRTTDRIPTRCRAPVPHAPPAACRATFGYACCGPTGAVQAEAFALGLHDFAGTSPAQIGGASAKSQTSLLLPSACTIFVLWRSNAPLSNAVRSDCRRFRATRCPTSPS